ncbi:hypothetical protein BN1723_018361, partial [Verticillium longisporum]
MVLLKSFVLGALAATAAAKSAVIDLIPSNFDKVVLKSGKPTLVEFFAPWCGHCKTLAPVYEELALAFENSKDKVQIAKVDADAQKELGKRFGIQGFPTLKCAKTECAICFDTLEVPVMKAAEADSTAGGVAGVLNRRNYMVTPCRHIFHSPCLESWMRYRLKCPICRDDLPPL